MDTAGRGGKRGGEDGSYSPHIDEVLRQGHGLGVARHGDGPVQATATATAADGAVLGAAAAIFAVGDADHGAAQLPAIWDEESRCTNVSDLV